MPFSPDQGHDLLIGQLLQADLVVAASSAERFIHWWRMGHLAAHAPVGMTGGITTANGGLFKVGGRPVAAYVGCELRRAHLPKAVESSVFTPSRRACRHGHLARALWVPEVQQRLDPGGDLHSEVSGSTTVAG